MKPRINGVFYKRTAAEITAVKSRHGIEGSYLLATGTLEPRKNIVRLIEAFKGLASANRAKGISLVLAGPVGWKSHSIRREIESNRHYGIRHIGFIPDDDLACLYSGAECFVFSSLYEGYGIPVREALCCGARVCASDIPEIREAGGGFCEYFVPSVEGIRMALEKTLGHPASIPESIGFGDRDDIDGLKILLAKYLT